MTTINTSPGRRQHREQVAAAAGARDEGMETAENAADPRIMLAIDKAIADANATGEPWSANDIRDQFPVTSQGLVGARVRAASMRRPVEMRKFSTTPSTLKSTHTKDIIVWVGITPEVID